jgi:hypothetical protein
MTIAPGLLERRLAAGSDPQISLATWASLVASTLGGLASAVGLVLLPDHGPARQIMAPGRRLLGGIVAWGCTAT